MIFPQRRSVRFALLCAASATLSFAQPTAPSHSEVTLLRALSELDPKIQADGEPWSVDPSSREQARQFFRTIYGISEGVPSEWNGNAATGVPGTTSAAFKEAVRNRVNFYRAYAGVPANVSMNATFSAKAQEAAMMMSANEAITHTPPSSWMHYTADGAEAADKSNLGYGSIGTETMDSYMRDHGAGNAVVGHRRWILYPQTQEMGTGDVEAQGSLPATQALWVQDARIFDARPSTRDELVAWPPKGHVPYQLIWPRWSVSLAGADFSAATVSMTRNGSPITATVETSSGSSSSIPEPTLIWLYDGKSGNDLASHDRPSADVDYDVTVSNVMVGGSTRSFSYKVTVFDPDVAGSDFTASSISGTTTPEVGNANAYTVAVPSFASGFQWRTLGVNGSPTTFGAENDLQAMVTSTDDRYSPRVSSPAASGNGAYHLVHPFAPGEDVVKQILTLPETYLIPTGETVSLNFSSRLGIATSGQFAEVQVSTNDGKLWKTIFTQIGSGQPGETGYQSKSLDLSGYAGSTLKVRFIYNHVDGDSFFNQTDAIVGWLIDDIVVSGGTSASVIQTSEHTNGNSFDFTPNSTGSVALQARGMFFGNYGMDWGPIRNVVAQPASNNGGSSGTSRIINLSVRANAASGDATLNVGMVVGGSGSKPVLVRIAGPTLTESFGLPGTAPDPALQIFTNGQQVAQNDNWDSSLSATFSSLGAFPLVENSKGSALTATLPKGSHSAVVNTQGQNGLVIVEAYDMEAVTAGTARLVNISARNHVGVGSNVLVAGFVIEGTGTKTLLIRGVGATLATSFGIQGALLNPQLRVQPLGSDTVVAGNDNWDNDAAVEAARSAVGAFELSSTDDAALLVTLSPGRYTATVSGVNDTTGIAIVEIYEVE